MSSIYSDIILDYYRYPRNKGQITSPRIKAKDSNPLCGDVVEIQMQVDGDNRVTEIKFDGNGCSISQASASMLTELVKGKTLDDLRKIPTENVLELIGVDVTLV